ncbi:Glucose-6-phosphate 1-dehydrogenase [Modestobacter italicus]|uniref:Glucose-6-phosphate 1-dehydrogenase n=1 Tax=Modestobacter italicus (strain DSM 44449 / CECT 9708 / BC 501) TaxID=2732864 RepID=I4EYJ8_MODI5|nr:glucose-6-phosphate dehydrogenase [Modestobacter marinus]CCH88461.1 Glucose-6-phosphate 1-dehydrogenase [Modestobacter marinus]
MARDRAGENVPTPSGSGSGEGAGPGSAGTSTLLVLGACGDLAARLLLPGLGGLLTQREVGDLFLVGSDTAEWSDDQWRQRVSESFATVSANGKQADEVVRSCRYLRADVTDEDHLRRLLDACTGQVTIYFALPPAVTARACGLLADLGVPEDTRLVMEKPFGTDGPSAHELNELVTRLVPENQVYRVDHYLGMSTVLNMLGMRFANRMLESVLDAENVSSVDIVFDESLGLEGRAGYYDGAGALVDMIQSHALQVLALLTMEAPSTLGAEDLQDAKSRVLRATSLWDEDPVRYSRRARYTAGTIGERRLPAYVDEEGVDPARRTETFAEVVVAVNTWRWAGVPFRLRAGKALSALRKEAVITFKGPRWVPEGLAGYEQPDRMRIGFDPDLVGLDFNLNGPGDPFTVDRVSLESPSGPGDLPPYGEVLAEVLGGDPTMSVRGDQAEQAWRIVAPVRAAWRDDRVELEEYPAGSDGPGAP